MLTESQLQDFVAYLRIPSISADPARASSMQTCADWLQGKFSRLGFHARVEPTAGPPVVLAKRAAKGAAKTVLIYGHYDVQPVDPVALWRHPPFEPFIENGMIFARGATDNKGQTMAHILGVEAAWGAGGPPVNLIFLLEGEEEIGSPHLAEFLSAHREELACDAIVVSDTSMIAPDFPAITGGLRGISCLELKVSGPAVDLHSGVFGGSVANPATELARLLAQLHDADGHVAVPGFYDAVADVSPDELKSWRDLPDYDAELLALTGSPAVAGERGYGSRERVWSRPTAEINGITAGYQGPGSKTIVPREAVAKLSFRLVPNQQPRVIADRVAAFFTGRAPRSVKVEVTYDHGGDPYLTVSDSPAFRAAQCALRDVFGREPALVREGLSIPTVSLFKRILGRDTLLIGLGLPDCAAHSPNESFPLRNLERGIALHRALLTRLAEAL